jgi:site-specific DNA-methyltransferase (adenine-specific)
MRDYGYKNQVGLEKTPEEFVDKLVDIFSSCKRVLRQDGTLWINIGDTYADTNGSTYKKGDLLGVPWMLANALRKDGWYLRSDIIWHKPNPIPSGSLNRPLSSHEYIFLLSKSSNYYYDAEAIKECAVEKNKDGTYKKRHKRDVWTVPVASFKGAHFAVFPTSLIAPCVQSSTSQHGCCANCGTNYMRVINRIRYATRPAKNVKIDDTGFANRDGGRHLTETQTVGWQKNCTCSTDVLDRCTILDPFCGSATTGVVSLQHNHKFIGIDGKEEYLSIAESRLASLKANIDFEETHENS